MTTACTQPPADYALPRLSELGLQDPLPEDMPGHLYFSLYSHMQCGNYVQCMQPFFKHFPAKKWVPFLLTRTS